MRVLLYDYFIPYQGLFKSEKENKSIETFQDFQSFFNAWKKDEEAIIIIPLHSFDITGFDIRKLFYQYGIDESKRFILIGDTKQIEFSLSQNDAFLKNDIEEIKLPILSNLLETAIKTKIQG